MCVPIYIYIVSNFSYKKVFTFSRASYGPLLYAFSLPLTFHPSLSNCIYKAVMIDEAKKEGVVENKKKKKKKNPSSRRGQFGY